MSLERIKQSTSGKQRYQLLPPHVHPLFDKFLKGHVQTVPWNMHAKFEVRSFDRLEVLAFNLRCAQTVSQTDTQPMKTSSTPFTVFTCWRHNKDIRMQQFFLAYSSQPLVI